MRVELLVASGAPSSIARKYSTDDGPALMTLNTIYVRRVLIDSESCMACTSTANVAPAFVKAFEKGA